jgi:exportin-5
MTKQPSRINHPNIHHVVYFLTLLPRQRARADAKADESVCRRRSAPFWMFFFSNLTRLFFSNPTRDVAFRRLTRFSRRPQIHFAAAMRCAEAGNVAGGKAHSAAVSAALGAAATYAEWAPLAPLFRSGLLDACGHFLSAAEFRAPACEVLRHVAHRRRGDVVNSVLNETRGKSKETNASSEADLAAQKEAAADAETVVVGFAAACRSLGAAAAAALASPPADPGDEHRDYVVRLTETAAAVASNHLHVLPDAQLRVAFLEALLGLTKYPTLDTLGAAVAAWPGILRAAGAELPNGFVRPEEKIVNDPPKERLTLPEGAVVALLETARHWLVRGGGVAAGLSASLCPESAGDEWEQEYETFDELREVWVQHRARLMEITKLCTCLVPVAAANAAATRVAQTCALVQAGGALDQTKASQTPSVDASVARRWTTRRARRLRARRVSSSR